MTIFQSPELTISQSPQAIFSFLGDFRNFEKLLPEQVINWQATEVQCSFKIQGMAEFAMHMGEKRSYSFVKYESESPSSISFFIEFTIQEESNDASKVKVDLHADLNPMLKMMASRPLKNFVNLLADKLKEVMEQPSGKSSD